MEYLIAWLPTSFFVGTYTLADLLSGEFKRYQKIAPFPRCSHMLFAENMCASCYNEGIMTLRLVVQLPKTRPWDDMGGSRPWIGRMSLKVLGMSRECIESTQGHSGRFV